jgi:beta-glucanase (GH16 family)
MVTKVDDCDCGFVDADEPTGTTFTSLLFVDFTKASWKELDNIFIKSSYNVNRSDAPYIRDFETDQIQLTDAGLELTVSPSPDGRIVPSASISTRQASYLHGSYRARIMVRDVPGTVTAFYNYHNDTSEVDIEHVSARGPTLLYSVKEQLYFANSNPDPSTYQSDTWNDTVTSFNQEFHEWSFTWLPEVVHYGLDANYSKKITRNVPQAPGTIVLSHWSNGNPRYSEGPPVVNSTNFVSYIQAVYNDANATALACKHTKSPCVVRAGTFVPSLNPASNSSSGTSLPSGVSSGTASTGSATPSPMTIPAVSHVNSGACDISPAGPTWLLALILLFFFR